MKKQRPDVYEKILADKYGDKIPSILEVSDLSEMTGFSLQTVCRWIKRDKLKAGVMAKSSQSGYIVRKFVIATQEWLWWARRNQILRGPRCVGRAGWGMADVGGAK